MFRRLHALYLRYSAVHADRLRSVAIGPVWRRVGQVERVERVAERVCISGWVDAERVALTWPGGSAEALPDLQRGDVAAQRNLPLETGFELAAPVAARPLTLVVTRQSGAPLTVEVPHPLDPPTPTAHRRLTRAFARDLVHAIPAMLDHWRRPTEYTRTAIKRALGLEIVARGHPVQNVWLAETPAQASTSVPPFTVIVPVHNAFDLVKRCLTALGANTEAADVIVVDDASSDTGVRAWLQEWVASTHLAARLITFDENRGFVGAVNAALAEVPAGHAVVLLNSDAMVPDGWAPRLLAPLSEAVIGSVTPMSNDAEIFSVPSMGPGSSITASEAERLDAVAQAMGGPNGLHLPDAPTGVGFCMALSPDWLARVPRLDPAFGRGYGEEVDWCQRTRKLGARHVGLPGLFVHHAGGQSFGAEEKAERIRASNAEIARRYPGFDADVQRYLVTDPLATPRMVLGLALAGTRCDALPVYLAHTLGGGAETALMAEVAGQRAAVVLRVGGVFRWQVELHMNGTRTALSTDDLDEVRRLLAPVPRLRIVYACGVGDTDPVGLPADLLSLRREGSGDTIEAQLHDYFMVSPSYTLLNAQGHFVGVPVAGDVDPAHQTRRPDGRSVTLAEWRKAWGALLRIAPVTAFSEASAEILRTAYPEADVHVVPHRLPVSVRTAISPEGSATIGILGNMNLQKGARVLCSIAQDAPQTRFVLIGLCDSAISLPRNVHVHGAYAPEDITDLAEAHGVTGWLMPSVWPETFSFVVREALATGLPVAGFDLGAQGDALARAENGVSVAAMPSDTAAARLLDALRAAVERP